MNSLVESHEPAPEFRAHLEWQIETALRRETRLAAPVSGRLRPLAAALMVVAALATGGIAGLASGQVQDARQRDQLIEAARSEETVARLRLDLAQANYDQARAHFELGTTGLEAVLDAERQVNEMRTAIARIQLDMEEIRATSAAPRNNLDAPLVGKRDFVGDRLTLELQATQRTLAGAEQAVQQAHSRMEVGMAPPAAVLQPTSEVARVRSRMELLMATRDLRQRYLRGEIKADALAAAARRTELTLQLKRSQQEIEIIHARLEEVRRQVEIGVANQLELKRSEVDLLERQLDMKRIQQELEALSAIKR